MKTFELPSLPASCFGLSLGTTLEEFDGKMEKFDNRVLWFGDYGEGSRGGGKKTVEEVVKTSADTLSPVVSDAAPGSAERIEALREFYSGGEMLESAFEISDDDIAARLAHTLEKMLKSESTASLSPAKKELRRERRRIAE